MSSLVVPYTLIFFAVDYVFHEVVCIREIKTAKIIGNWSESEVHYVFTKVKFHGASFFTISQVISLQKFLCMW